MTKDIKDMAEDELEAHILSCGHLMEKEMDAGNREAAENWRQAMHLAIAARKPEVQQLMEQAIMQRIHEPCYFNTQGEIDRGQLPAMLRGQAT